MGGALELSGWPWFILNGALSLNAPEVAGMAGWQEYIIDGTGE